MRNEDRMNQDLLQYYLGKEEPGRSCLLALRSIILDLDGDISETRKWGMPCFCYKKRMFCYLWTDKKTDEPYMLLVEGRFLEHPELEAGNRSRMKIFRIDPEKDLPVKTILQILREALAFYRTDVLKGKE